MRKAGFFERRSLQPARSVGRYALYSLCFAYPLAIVSVGIVFGGLVFWSLLAGSAGIFWLVIRKTGYAKNFANYDVGYRKFVGLIGAFLLALGMIYGLIYLHGWIIPVFAGCIITALIVGVQLSKGR